MAEQITDKIFISKGYVDDSMSIDTIESLLSLPRGRKFVGLTVTVLNAIVLIKVQYQLIFYFLKVQAIGD